MASGVKVAEEVKIKYDDIKKKKSYRYLVFYIKDEKLITVEKIGERGANYNDFLRDVTGSGPDDCRYCMSGRERERDTRVIFPRRPYFLYVSFPASISFLTPEDALLASPALPAPQNSPGLFVGSLCPFLGFLSSFLLLRCPFLGPPC
jgi:hypothetical protein